MRAYGGSKGFSQSQTTVPNLFPEPLSQRWAGPRSQFEPMPQRRADPQSQFADALQGSQKSCLSPKHQTAAENVARTWANLRCGGVAWGELCAQTLEYIAHVMEDSNAPHVEPAFASRCTAAAEKMLRSMGKSKARGDAHTPVPSLERSLSPSDFAPGHDAYSALVVDCGTSESKVLVYNFCNKKVTFQELEKMPAASEYFDDPQSFAEKVHQQFRQVHVDVGLVAASQWMRTAQKAQGKSLSKGTALMNLCTRKGVLSRVIDGSYDAWMETTAVEYLSQKEQLHLQGHWASGGGSTQLSHKFQEVHCMELGSAEGIKLILEAKDNPVKGVELWTKKVELSVKQMREEHMHTLLTGRILWMSAVYYAAKAAGLALGTFVPVQEVKAALKKHIDELTGEAKGLSGEPAKEHKAHARTPSTAIVPPSSWTTTPRSTLRGT